MEQEVGGSSPPNCTIASSLHIHRASVPAPGPEDSRQSNNGNPALLANFPPFTHNLTIEQRVIDQTISIRFFGGRMIFVRSGQPGLMFAIALSVSLWSGATQAYTPEQQQACTPDAFRLCGDAIPDVDRVTVCMIRNKAQLSPGCRAFFRAPEPERAPAVTSVTARKPVRLTPVTARRPVSVKPKKPKKSVKPASRS